MSILNLCIRPDRALVAVDSRQLRDDGSGTGVGDALPGALEKLSVYPVAGVVYAGRGGARLTVTIAAMLAARSSFLVDVDGFDAAFPQIFRLAWAQLASASKEAGGLGLTGSFHCLAGWSRARNCMRAITFEKKHAGEDAKLERYEEDGEYFSPWHHQQGELPRVDSVSSMMAACRQQIDFGAMLHGARSGVGWPCVVAEITRDTIKVHRAAT